MIRLAQSLRFKLWCVRTTWPASWWAIRLKSKTIEPSVCFFIFAVYKRIIFSVKNATITIAIYLNPRNHILCASTRLNIIIALVKLNIQSSICSFQFALIVQKCKLNFTCDTRQDTSRSWTMKFPCQLESQLIFDHKNLFFYVKPTQ